MLQYMLDTNIVIYAMRAKPLSLKEIFTAQAGRMCISTITYMELVYGVERSTRRNQNLKILEGFVARMDVLALDEKAAMHAGQIRSELAKQGSPIGPYDQLIAGHARSLGVVLVTNNEREFERVPGIRLENWASA